FVAFLDGTQGSRIACYVEGLPIIHGTVAAVIRERKNRRLATWRHNVATRVYAPRRLLTRNANDALDQLPFEVVDVTAPSAEQETLIEHPLAVSDVARHFVQRDREGAELDLAAQWCNVMSGALFVDGGI